MGDNQEKFPEILKKNYDKYEFWNNTYLTEILDEYKYEKLLGKYC